MSEQIKAPTLVYKQPDGVLYEVTPAKNNKYHINVISETSKKVLQSGYLPVKKMSDTLKDCKYLGIKGSPPRDLF